MPTTFSGRWAFDTQILLYALDGASPFHERTRDLFHDVFEKNIECVVAGQNILEAEHVLIKAYRSPPKDAVRLVGQLAKDYRLAVVMPFLSTLDRYHRFIQSMEKVDIFDCYLAATLLDNGIFQLLSGNANDFSGVPGLTVVNPFLKKDP